MLLNISIFQAINPDFNNSPSQINNKNYPETLSAYSMQNPNVQKAD
jgi:hypothetical protein